MTTQPQSAPDPTTKQAICDLARTAVTRFSEILKEHEIRSEVEIQWKIGSDGNIRETHKFILAPHLTDDWLHSLAGYDECVQLLRADPVIGPHLHSLVGTLLGSRSLKIDDVLQSVILGMFSESSSRHFKMNDVLQSVFLEPIISQGDFRFNDDLFTRAWLSQEQFFCANGFWYKLVAPLPHLIVSNFPLKLNEEVFLDRLSDDEVTRCYQIGVIKTLTPTIRFINSQEAVGIRQRKFLRKVIRKSGDSDETGDTTNDGSFGKRPILQSHLIVNDVLLALRLFKRTKITATGSAMWSDSAWLNASTHFQIIGGWPNMGGV